MTAKQFELRLGDMIWCEPHGAACVMGAVDNGSTFIVGVEVNDKAVFTIITMESIKAKMEIPPRLTRLKNAAFGVDLLAQPIDERSR